jgi:PAS domain S-box-containing protein
MFSRDVHETPDALDKESRRMLQTLFGNLPGMAYRCKNDRRRTVEYASEGCFQLTGYLAGDFVGNRVLPFSDIIHPDDREDIWEQVQEGVDQRQHFVLEYRIRTKSGKEKWVLDKGVGVFSGKGELQALEGFVFDSTERKETGIALRESEDKLRLTEAQYKTTFNNAPVGIVTATRESNLMSMNRAFCRMLGYRKSELIKMTSHEFTHPDDQEATRKKIGELYSGKSTRVKLEKKYIHKNGTVIHAAMNAALVSSADGEPLFHVAQIEDISERKRMEDQLDKLGRLKEDLFITGTLEEKAKRITDGMVDIFKGDFARLWIIRPADRCRSGCFHAVTEIEVHRCGMREECLHLVASSGRYTHTDGKIHGRVPFECYRIGQVASGEMSRFISNNVPEDSRIHDGEWARQLELKAFAGYRLLSTEGQSIGVLALYSRHTISPEDEAMMQTIAGSASHVIQTALAEGELRQHRDRLEELVIQRTEELRQSNERLKLAMEGANDGLWDFYPKTGQTYYSPRWFTMLGYQPDQFPHNYEAWVNLLHPEDKERAKQIVMDFLENKLELYICEFRMRTAKDNWRWILARGKAVEWDEEGNVSRVVGTHTDITERKQVEEQLRILVAEQERANKELEDFAYIVSHDLKAPLRGISSLANWLADDFSEQLGEEGGQYLDKLQFRAKRMHHLIEGILQYSRAGRSQAAAQKLDTHNIVREVTEGIAIPPGMHIHIKGELPEITYDKIHLFQVFQNLIGNAVKHMGKPEGEVTVSCSPRQSMYEFCVGDTGVGIEEKHFQRIFKIFQALNPGPDIDSTGIGLSLVKKIVEKNDGQVWVESEPGRGSWFYFTVPRRPVSKIHAMPGRCTILLVDDSRDFIEVSGSMLELEGYNTLCALSTPEAVQVLEQYPGEVQLALMDLHIPGEKAVDRLKTLKHARPGMKIIACTGKDVSDVQEKLSREGLDGILRKPFKTDDFYRILESLEQR